MEGTASRRNTSCHNAPMSAEMGDGFPRFSVKDTVLGGAKCGRTGAVDFGVLMLYLTGRIIESYNRQGRNAVI